MRTCWTVNWARFKSACYSGKVVGSFDREWFALFEPRAMPDAMGASCVGGPDDLRTYADQIRTGMIAIEEAARRAGVYPASGATSARACAWTIPAGIASGHGRPVAAVPAHFLLGRGGVGDVLLHVAHDLARELRASAAVPATRLRTQKDAFPLPTPFSHAVVWSASATPRPSVESK